MKHISSLLSPQHRALSTQLRSPTKELKWWPRLPKRSHFRTATSASTRFSQLTPLPSPCLKWADLLSKWGSSLKKWELLLTCFIIIIVVLSLQLIPRPKVSMETKLLSWSSSEIANRWKYLTLALASNLIISSTWNWEWGWLKVVQYRNWVNCTSQTSKWTRAPASLQLRSKKLMLSVVLKNKSDLKLPLAKSYKPLETRKIIKCRWGRAFVWRMTPTRRIAAWKLTLPKPACWRLPRMSISLWWETTPAKIGSGNIIAAIILKW